MNDEGLPTLADKYRCHARRDPIIDRRNQHPENSLNDQKVSYEAMTDPAGELIPLLPGDGGGTLTSSNEAAFSLPTGRPVERSETRVTLDAEVERGADGRVKDVVGTCS